MSVFIHPQALCESAAVGGGTRIWAFAHVLPGARIGRDCNICDGVFIENEVMIGDAVTIKCGVQLWDGLRVGNRVFIGPNASFTNDIFPRSKRHLERYPETIIDDGASVGANATVLPGLRIGTGAMIGAGAVVTKDVPARAVVAGNPAKVVGYAEADSLNPAMAELPADFRCRLVRLHANSDERGRLSVLDSPNLPFQPRRFFVVDHVPPGSVRGSHAHRRCHQLLIVISGRLTAVVDDGARAYTVEMSSPEVALHVAPMTWGMQYGHSEDATLLVVTSESYDRADYIDDYEIFRSLAR